MLDRQNTVPSVPGAKEYTHSMTLPLPFTTGVSKVCPDLKGTPFAAKIISTRNWFYFYFILCGCIRVKLVEYKHI